VTVYTFLLSRFLYTFSINCFSQNTLCIVAVGGKDFRKKSNRAVDNSTNPGDLGQNEDSDGAFYSGNNELVYEL